MLVAVVSVLVAAFVLDFLKRAPSDIHVCFSARGLNTALERGCVTNESKFHVRSNYESGGSLPQGLHSSPRQ